jgi:hypothetical protein
LKYVVGKLAHAMILEGKDLRDLYAIKPRGLNLGTKEGKAWKAEQTLPILKEEDANRVPRMADAIAAHPLASKALKKCILREQCLEGTYRGVDTKALLDAVGGGVLVGRPFSICDLKTTNDSRPYQFSKRIMELDYDFQAVFYKWMYGDHDKSDFTWIAVENFSPFTVNVFYPSYEMLQSGQAKMDAAITRYKLCQEHDNWSASMFNDYSDDIQEIAPPDWRIKELQGAGLV